MFKQKVILILCFLLCLFKLSFSQFVDIIQTEPFANPASMCAGGVMTFRLNNLQNLNVGSVISIELSNSSGNFPGTMLTTVEYSFDNISWTVGNYIWTSNVSNSYIRVNIPATTIPGAGYTARAVSSSPNMAGGNNNGLITITAPITTIANVAQNNYGTGNWFGHVYTWTPTTTAQINTTALVAAQNFFSAANYKGHVVKNNLSFDDDFQGTGFLGSSSFYNQTSIACGGNLSSKFAIRYKRTENFAAGRYALSIQADDGIRLSIDGGATWLLDAFVEQQYAASFKTTATTNPNGICLGGSVDLVVEYFQNPANAHVTVNITPLSSTVNSPTNQIICAGASASFNATCTEVGATYQWQFFDAATTSWVNITNVAPYTGANAAVLTISNAQTILNGTQYRCMVGNSCPTLVASSTATLTVNSAIDTFTTQPNSIAVCQNNSTSFSVVFSGANPNYQWNFSTDGGVTFNAVTNNANFSGAGTATLSIINAPIAFNNYQFTCTSTNSCGNTFISNAATLNVGAGSGATITGQPAPINQSLCVGDNATIVINTTSVILAWQLSTDGGITFNDINNIAGISGATSTTLVITAATLSMNSWIFRCKIPSCGGNIFSNNSTLQVHNIQTILTQPTLPMPMCAGANAVISIIAHDAVSYQWIVVTNGASTNLTDNAVFSGSNTPTLSITNIPSILNGSFLYCKVYGACNTNTPTNSLTIVLSPLPTVTTPLNQTVCVGGTANFNVATTSASATYQWSVSTDLGLTFNTITNGGQYSGANTNSLNVSNCTLANNNNVFKCVIVDGCNVSVASGNANLIIDVTTVVNIITQPQTQISCEGDMVIFNCNTNSQTSYQWQINTGSGFADVIENDIIGGSNSNTLTVYNALLSLNNTSFRCIINACGNLLSSDTAMLFTIPKPHIITQPKNILLCSNTSNICSMVADGNDLKYQWQIDDGFGSFINIDSANSILVGAQSNTLAITAQNTLRGKKLRCIVKNLCTTTTTNEVTIQIIEPPQVISQPISDTICEGKNNQYVFGIIGDSLKFNWYLCMAGSNIFKPIANSAYFDSVNTKNLFVKNAPIELNGMKLICIAATCSDETISDTITVTINPKILQFYIPTGFTPNNDGLNDQLEFVGIKDTEIQGLIFNRWGEKLFSFSKNNSVWDGKYNNSPVPAGVYNYIITNEGNGCSKIDVDGYVNVVR